MQRPTGVTILAILGFIGTACFVCVAIALVLFGSAIAAMMKDSAAGGTVAAAIGIVGAVFCLFAALVGGLLSWGLWALKNIARVISVILHGLGVAFALLALLGALVHFNIIAMFLLTIRVAVGGIIVWYLLQPHVKKAFGAEGSSI